MGLLRFLFVVVVLAACGCSSDPLGVGKTVPVRGQVLVNGQPLHLPSGAFGRVWFSPDTAQGNTCPQVPSGDLDADGRFELSVRGQKGAPPGWYKIMVVASDQADPAKPSKKRPSLVNARYTAVETSGLVILVVETPAPGVYDLSLKK